MGEGRLRSNPGLIEPEPALRVHFDGAAWLMQDDEMSVFAVVFYDLQFDRAEPQTLHGYLYERSRRASTPTDWNRHSSFRHTTGPRLR